MEVGSHFGATYFCVVLLTYPNLRLLGKLNFPESNSLLNHLRKYIDVINFF